MAVVGELEIKTIVNNKETEKGLRELKKKLQRTESELSLLMEQAADKKATIDALRQQQKELQKTNDKYKELRKRIREIEEERGRVSTLTESEMRKAYAENPELSTGYFELLKKSYGLKGTGFELNKVEGELKTVEDEYQNINNEINKIVSKQNEYKDAIEETETAIKKAQFAEVFKKQGKEIGKTILKIGKLGLALIGIRGMYGAIRSAISTLSSSNEDIANTLNYTKTMLATALEPIVIRIVGWIKQLMALVNYISKRWFGRDLLAETDKNLKKANKSAGALKKTLAGFDEMNILNSSSSGGGGGLYTDLDLDKYEENAKKIYERTSKYLFGGENLWESFKTGFQGAWDDILALISPFGGIWLRDIVMPILRLTNQGFAQLIPELAPYWEEIINNNDGTLNELEILWLGFKNYLKDKILGGLQQDWENLKLWLFKLGVNIYNYFVDKINNLLGIFGVHLDRIELETEETGKKVEENLVEPLDEMSNTEYKIDIVSNSAINIKNALSDMWNYLTGLTKKKWNISALFSGSTSGGLFGAKGLMYYPKLPKLAVGGIVNQPGRGVPYRGATIGEHGAEAVVPLTDSQQMELLGATIGRYITINNTNPIYMNGRLIAKEINRSNAEDDFAFNR